MPFDRRHIFNASYSYSVGNACQEPASWVLQRTAGRFPESCNYQSGANLPSIISSNFGLQRHHTGSCGRGSCRRQQHQHLHDDLRYRYLLGSISNTNMLGTPDVNLQPRYRGHSKPADGIAPVHQCERLFTPGAGNQRRVQVRLPSWARVLQHRSDGGQALRDY